MSNGYVSQADIGSAGTGGRIGFNVKKTNDLMANVAKAYNDLGIYTQEQWQPLITVLQNNWIGEDEQDFEKELAKRICTLYTNAYDLVNSCVNTLAGLAQAWYDFQQKNTLSGAAAESRGAIDIDIPSITKVDPIVEPKTKEFSNDTDRGLSSSSSKTSIQQAVETFVNDIKKETSGLFEAIQVNNAFFGGQTSTIKTYVEKVGVAVGEVTVAVRDMYEKLDQLASTNYNTATTDINTQMGTSTTEVETRVNDLGNSKWV